MTADHDIVTVEELPDAVRRKRRTQHERSTSTRTALLDAALSCLARAGYAGTTFQAVCEEGGVSRGAVLHHFRSKPELIAQAFMHAQSRKLDEGPHVPANASVADELAATRARVARWFPMSFAFYAELARNAELRAEFDAVCAQQQQPVTDRFLAMTHAIDAAPDPLALRYVIGCFLRGLELEALMSDAATVDAAYACFESMLQDYVAAAHR